MELVPLRELKTQDDFAVKGKMLRLRIDTCGHDGFVVAFISEEKLPAEMPSFILKAMGFELSKEGMIEKTVVQQHVHPKWHDRFTGKKLEDRVREKIEEIKKDFKDIQDRHDTAQRLTETI